MNDIGQLSTDHRAGSLDIFIRNIFELIFIQTHWFDQFKPERTMEEIEGEGGVGERSHLMASRISDGICFRGDLLRLQRTNEREMKGNGIELTFDDEQLSVCVVIDQDSRLRHTSWFRERCYSL